MRDVVLCLALQCPKTKIFWFSSFVSGGASNQVQLSSALQGAEI